MAIVKIALAVVLLLVVATIGLVYAFPEKVVRYAVELARQKAGLMRKDIVRPDALQYLYLEGGQGEPLMLLHGFGSNKDSFVQAAKFLTAHYRVVMPDHIGFGESSRPLDADYAPPAQAQRLHALAQALGIKKLHLGGSSMGGHIALTYAALYPAETASLWLIDPAGIWSAPPGEIRKVVNETGRNPIMARNEDEFAQILPFIMSKPPFIPRPLLDVWAQERIRNYPLEQRILPQIVNDSVEKGVTGLNIPTLIVWGAQDRVIHIDTAEILHKLIPRSQLIIMPGIGHVPMNEKPKQSAEDYLLFRRSL